MPKNSVLERGIGAKYSRHVLRQPNRGDGELEAKRESKDFHPNAFPEVSVMGDLRPLPFDLAQ